MSPASASPTASSSTIVHSSRVDSRSTRTRPAIRPVLLVDVHQVVRAERAERQAEQAEHADRRAADRQAQRAGRRIVALAQPRQLAEGREVGQAGGADLARAAGRPRRGHRVRVIGLPGGSGGGVGRHPRRDRRARRPSSRPADGSGSRRPAPDGTPSRRRCARGRPRSGRRRGGPGRRRPGPVRSMTGARMNTAWTGRSPRTGTDSSASNESSWRPNALRSTVTSRSGRIGGSSTGDLATQDDHPGARPEDRRAGLGEVEDRLAQPPALDELAHRRALAARQDQAADALRGRGARARARPRRRWRRACRDARGTPPAGQDTDLMQDPRVRQSSPR